MIIRRFIALALSLFLLAPSLHPDAGEAATPSPPTSSRAPFETEALAPAELLSAPHPLGLLAPKRVALIAALLIAAGLGAGTPRAQGATAAAEYEPAQQAAWQAENADFTAYVRDLLGGLTVDGRHPIDLKNITIRYFNPRESYGEIHLMNTTLRYDPITGEKGYVLRLNKIMKSKWKKDPLLVRFEVTHESFHDLSNEQFTEWARCVSEEIQRRLEAAGEKIPWRTPQHSSIDDLVFEATKWRQMEPGANEFALRIFAGEGLPVSKSIRKLLDGHRPHYSDQYKSALADMPPPVRREYLLLQNLSFEEARQLGTTPQRTSTNKPPGRKLSASA